MASSGPKRTDDLNDAYEPSEQAPLLPSIGQHLIGPQGASENVHHVLGFDSEDSFVMRSRRSLRWFLPSKYGHYFVIILVSLDITSIFADFLVSLHVCEHRRQQGFDEKGWLAAEDTLGAFSLLFSSLFMLELLASLFAFGLSYLKSAFHLLDATVIIASFVFDVALRGGLEEAGSLIIVLRLWRVFKIIEEFSTGADSQMEELHEYIERLQQEKQLIIQENQTLKGRLETSQSRA